MKKLLITTLLLFYTASVLSAQDQVSPEYFSQWHINYADYLIDVGKYLEALESYNTAYESTVNNKIRLKVLIHKANLLSTFLDAQDEALKIYDEITANYPEKAEFALYRKGFLLYDMGRYKDTVLVLGNYLKKYPSGMYRFQAEVILERAKKETEPPVIESIKRPVIRVLLHKKAPSLTITGRNLKVNNKNYPSDTLRFNVKNDKILLQNSSLASNLIVSSDYPVEVIKGKKRKKVRGEVNLSVKNGKITAINTLDIESYLRSVVPSESYASWPHETLKAQAVAARTYALYQINHRKKRSYDIVDNEGDQVYGGVKKETKATDKAVMATDGLVLTQRKRPILAMYTANSGGYTADAKAVFQLSKNYLIAHPDSDSLKGKSARWDREFTVKEVETALSKRGLNVRGLQNILASEKGPSGRIIRIKIVSEKGAKSYRTWSTLRRALKLPEILFDISKKGDTFEFQGRGWGHGVGYSQWGSAIMGQKGSTYSEILSFYYPNTELLKLW